LKMKIFQILVVYASVVFGVNGAKTATMQLVGGSNKYSGTVILTTDVSAANQGPVCGLDVKKAQVDMICKQLGSAGGSVITLANPNTLSNWIIQTSITNCNTDPTKPVDDVAACPEDKISPGCTLPAQALAISCTPPTPIPAIAFVTGGANAFQGIVKVDTFAFPLKTANTICPNNFNINSANVLCKQLLFPGGADSFSTVASVGNPAQGFTGTACTGQENDFNSCPITAGSPTACPTKDLAISVVCHRASVGIILGGSTYNGQWDTWVPSNQFEIVIPNTPACTSSINNPLPLPSAILANPIAFAANLNNIDNLIYCGFNWTPKTFVCLMYSPSGRDQISNFAKGTWIDMTVSATGGPRMLHANNPAIFVPNANPNVFEVWIYDDNTPEIFTLPENLLNPATNKPGFWKEWPGAKPVVSTAGAGASMGLLGTKIYLFGGYNFANSRVQSYDTALGAAATWINLAATPGRIVNSQPVLIPGVPAIGVTPAVPAKFIVPLYTTADTVSAAQIFNTGTNTWEPVVSTQPMTLTGACGANFKPGDTTATGSVFFYGGGIQGTTAINQFTPATSVAAQIAPITATPSLKLRVAQCAFIPFALFSINGGTISAGQQFNECKVGL